MPQIPPTPFGPLAGLKVIELGQLIAGPFAGKTLGDFGAEVIKIEPPATDGKPGGDPLRLWRMLHQGTSVWWQVQSRNKKSVALDLKDPQSRDIVRRLIDEAEHLELIMEPELSIVLFKRSGWTMPEYQQWSDRLLADGDAFVVPTSWAGDTVLRICIVNPRTTLDDVRMLIDSLA